MIAEGELVVQNHAKQLSVGDASMVMLPICCDDLCGGVARGLHCTAADAWPTDSALVHAAQRLPALCEISFFFFFFVCVWERHPHA
jgi:hypothetical protein